MKRVKEAEVRKILRENPQAILINALSASDFENEHIPHSINLPIENNDFITAAKEKVKDKKALIIVYCANLHCPASTQAATLLEENGYTNVFDFKGGMKEWNEAGNEVEVGL